MRRRQHVDTSTSKKRKMRNDVGSDINDDDSDDDELLQQQQTDDEDDEFEKSCKKQRIHYMDNDEPFNNHHHQSSHHHHHHHMYRSNSTTDMEQQQHLHHQSNNLFLWTQLPPILVMKTLQFISIPLRCYTRYKYVEDVNAANNNNMSIVDNTGDVVDGGYPKYEVADAHLIKLLFGYFKADSQRTVWRLYTNIDTRGCHIYKHRFHRIVCESNFWNILNSNFASLQHILNPFRGVNDVSIAYVNAPTSNQTASSKTELEEIANRGLNRSFKKCTQMQRFSLDDRNRVTFDGLSWLCNCKQLTYLKLYRTRISLAGVVALAGLPNLKTFLVNMIKLPQNEYLEGTGTPLHSSKRPRVLSETFSNHPSITNLELTVCYLDEVDLINLLKNDKLVSLRLRQNKITSIPMKPQDVPSNSTLTHLDLSCNAIGCAGVKSLLSWVSPSLVSLSLCSCRIEEEGASLLFSSKYLQKLDLSKNTFQCEPFQALENNEVMEELDISGSYVCDHVARSISQNRSLTSLNLVSCHMDDRIGTILFKDTTRFKHLLVADNLFTSVTLRHILKNQQLHTLDFSSVKSLSLKGYESLANHPNLKILKLYKNNINSIGAHTLFRSKSITSLNLSKNKIGDDAVKPLAENTVLKELVMWSNNISDKGVDTIFRDNKTLVTVNLLTNNLTENAHRYLKSQSQLLLGGSTFM